MDRSVDVEEESQWKSDSGASASKPSLGSIVQINSIAIEISTGAMGEIRSSPVHEHFSIRGYVAEMRKKDRRICSPFTSQGCECNINATCDLPPLSVPTFRWWQCSSCIADIPSEMRNKELVIAGNITPAVSNGGFAGRNDRKENDLVKNLGNSNLGCIRGRKAARSKKAKKDIKDKEEAGTRRNDMQETNLLQICEKPDTADLLCKGGEKGHVSSGSDDALPCKRKPKLRSLADIMVEEKKSASDGTHETRSVSSYEIQDNAMSTETEPFFSSPHRLEASSSSLRRKRKSAFEKDRGLSRAVNNPSGSAKKSKGLVLVADRTCKRQPVTCEQESGDDEEEEEEEDAATNKLNSLVAAKALKLRKNKGLIGRKPKQSQLTEDTVVLSRDLHQKNSSRVENLEDNVTKIRNGTNPVEETGRFSRLFRYGNERGALILSRESPQVEVDHGTLKTPSDDGNGKGKEKVPLDLSLNSFVDVEKTNPDDQESSKTRRFIPDLNEEFPFKTQLPPLHNRDPQMYRSEEPVEPSNPRKNETGKKIASSSDDIPMEIVELLAKHQHERALGISKKHPLPEEISTSTRGFPPLYTDGTRNASMCFPFPGGRTVANGPNRILGIPLNFPQPQFFNSFAAPNEQRIMQFPGSSSSYITGPRISSGGSDFYWPPRRDINGSFPVGPNQTRPFQASSGGIRMPLFGDKHVRGKTVSNNVKEFERKKTVHDGILLKKGRIGSSSIDPYSNDTIPAMQLLSLMDLSSGSSSMKSSPKNFLQKPLPSLGPRGNGKENLSVLSGSLYSFKGFPKFGSGVFVTGESSKKGSSSEVPPELGNSTAMKPRSDLPPLVVCTLNKNPADFSIPEARNKYTITARDLKPRKRIPRKQKPSTVAEDGRKRQRVMKKDASSSGKSKAASENI